MRISKFKINIFLFFVITIVSLVILFVDSEKLNLLFIDYNNLVIDEFIILDVNYDEVVYNNEQTTTNNNSVVSAVSNSSITNNVSSVNRVAFSDYWVWPTDGNYTITSYYSDYHKALDIYKGYGTNIYAVNNGVVTSVKGGCIVGNLSCNGRGGNYVVIRHNKNNYYTVYMHLKDIRVNVGDVVSRGQVIGTMGNTGNVIPVPTASAPYLGTHLHFCLYIGEPYNGGYAVNPMRLY